MTTVAPDTRRGLRLAHVAQWRWIRIALASLWLALALTVVGIGERESSFARLEAAIAAGDVGDVTVRGDGLPEGATGLATVTVVWRDAIVRRSATFRETTNGETVEEHLRTYDTDLRIAHEPLRGGGGGIGAWQEVPTWVLLSGLLAWLALMSAVVIGPEARRATRAAWFWLVLLAPYVGIPAYLVLGAPATTDAHIRRRLTGGWAFLLALCVGGMSAVG